MKHCSLAICATLVSLCLWATTAAASVVISGTRVVFHAQQGEATVRLTNNNDHPALVETWIDAGDINSTPDTVHTPFLITPPMFRMDAHKDQSLRILYVPGKQPLPTDRESVFWLNVLEIPPKPAGPQFAGKNYLQFAIRTRIKLFYRPAKLPGDVLKAPDELTFKAAAGSSAALVVHNPTPYYITISGIALGANASLDNNIDGMVAPFDDLTLNLKGLAHAPTTGTPVVFATINDYGTTDSHKGVIAQ